MNPDRDTPPPRPTAPTSSDDNDERPGQSVVGGYYYNPRPNVGGYGPYRPGPTSGFDPYRAGDMRRILGMLVNSGSIMDLQLALISAGLLDEDTNLGWIDSATQDAFEDVLAIANQNGMSWQDVLSQAGAGGTYSADGSGGGVVPPNIIELPNEEDLDKALEETGMSLTGERLDDDLRASATQAILDTLRTQQERQLQRELSASPGSTVFTESAPDVGRLLEEQIEERAPQKVMNKAARDAMDVWFALIGEQA